MANKVGQLQTKPREGKSDAYVGQIVMADVISGTIAIIENENMREGGTMTHNVVQRVGDHWGQIGRAKFERRNKDSALYILFVIETPKIKKAFGEGIWFRAFPQSGNLGDEPDAQAYDITWGDSGKQAAPSGDFNLDDDLPDF